MDKVICARKFYHYWLKRQGFYTEKSEWNYPISNETIFQPEQNGDCSLDMTQRMTVINKRTHTVYLFSKIHMWAQLSKERADNWSINSTCMRSKGKKNVVVNKVIKKSRIYVF